jgi:hypothetical protein
MIKLKPIAEQVLLKEADEKVTWGDVQTLLNAVIAAQKTGGAKVAGAEIAKSGLKKFGMAGAKWAANLLTGGSAGVIIDLVADHGEDLGAFLLGLGKSVVEKELKNPKSSEFKAMTGPFWEAIKLSPEVSTLLDDKIEKAFIDQVILPKLKTPGSESEELPNMDELLGKWLNDMGKLKDKADIHFKGASGDL